MKTLILIDSFIVDAIITIFTLAVSLVFHVTIISCDIDALDPIKA